MTYLLIYLLICLGINSSHESYLSLLQNGSSDALNIKYDELEKEKYSLEKEIEDLQNQLKSQQENENNIDETGNQIDSIKIQKKQKLKQKIPALKHKLNLYKGLFDIEWNVNLDQNDLSGFMNDKNDQQIKAFKFNTNEISKFDLVNEMWKMCDSEIQNEINDLQQLLNVSNDCI